MTGEIEGGNGVVIPRKPLAEAGRRPYIEQMTNTGHGKMS
jgi:hypothetical protein